MSWFPVPWTAVIGILTLLIAGGALCFFFATPFFPVYLIVGSVIALLLFAFLMFVQYLPILLPVLLVLVLLYMYAVREGWIPASFALSAARAARGAGGYFARRSE